MKKLNWRRFAASWTWQLLCRIRHQLQATLSTALWRSTQYEKFPGMVLMKELNSRHNANCERTRQNITLHNMKKLEEFATSSTWLLFLRHLSTAWVILDDKHPASINLSDHRKKISDSVGTQDDGTDSQSMANLKNWKQKCWTWECETQYWTQRTCNHVAGDTWQKKKLCNERTAH